MLGPAGLEDDVAEPGIEIENGRATIFDKPVATSQDKDGDSEHSF